MSYDSKTMTVLEIESENDFSNAIQTGVTLAEFFGKWCGACNMQAPAVELVAEEYSDIANFIKINVDEHPILAKRFGVESLPTFLVFEDGDLIDRFIGITGVDELSEKIVLSTE